MNRSALLAVMCVAAGACSRGEQASWQLTDPLAGATLSSVARADTVRCDIARLEDAGTYRVISAHFRVDGERLSRTGTTVRVVFRDTSELKEAGKATEKGGRQADPKRFIACEIPDAPAALAWFSTIAGPEYGVASVVEVSASKATIEPSAFIAASKQIPTASLSTSRMVEECPPEAIYCDGSGEWDGSAPSTSGQAQYSLEPVSILCFGQTDNIHISGFEVSVHSRTGCNVAGDLTVYLVLDRQRCIWFFCWWSGQATGNSAAFGLTSYDAVARAPCKTGYWHAYGSHTALFPDAYGAGRTDSYGYIPWC